MSNAPPATPPDRQHTFTDHAGQPVTVIPASSQTPTPSTDPKLVEVKKVEQTAAAEEKKKEAVIVEEKKPEEKKP